MPNRRRAMILVTGATGLNGKELLRRLSARGIATRALVRNPAKAGAIAALPQVEIVQGDMARPETLTAALRDVDRAMLISSSDPMMLDVQSNFIDAAGKAGVKHIVKLSGIMPELDSAFRFARMHGEIEQRLEASGMAFTHLRAGEFRMAYFRQAPMIAAKGAIFLPMAEANILRPIRDPQRRRVSRRGAGAESLTPAQDDNGASDEAFHDQVSIGQ